MADFLSHLAQRLDASTVGVQPRLPAMFEAASDDTLPADRIGHTEPATGIVEDAPGDLFEADTRDVEPRQRRRRDARASPQRPMHQAVPPDAPFSDAETAVESVHREAVDEMVDDRAPPSAVLRPRMSERPEVTPDVEPASAAPLRPSTGAARKPWPVRPVEPEQPLPRAASGTRPDIDNAATLPGPGAAAPLPAVAVVVPASARMSDSEDAPAFNAATSLRPRAEPPSPRSATPHIDLPARTPAPEPIIHVTIGRIEIRANTAAAPVVRKSTNASPVMALEEYLRSRTEGGRR